jgi:hypothetical protein
MKNLLILFAALAIFSCRSSLNLSKNVPSCVEKKIRAALDEPVQNPPLEVWEWKAAGSTYYYFTAPCCDQFNMLYDASCNYVCAPDGGFTGRGDGKCPEFESEPEKTLIWKDERDAEGRQGMTTPEN